jgi:glycosyltransferase involved in cell wall biosynthesis
MRVLLYAPNYLPATRYGGPIRSSHGLASALVDQGHDVSVVTSNVDGVGTLDVPLGRAVNIDGVKVHYFPIGAPRPLYRSQAMLRAVRDMIAKFDVVHTNGMFLWPGPMIAAAARRASVPYVVAPRGMLAPELISAKSTWIKWAWITLYERRHLAGAAVIHVTSDLEANDIRRAGLDLAPLAVIPNGIDVKSARISPKAGDVYWRGVPAGHRVAFLARLDWKKGADLAIDAVATIKDANLWIGGYDQIGLRKGLEAKAMAAGCGDRVRFLGPVEGADKWAFLAGADILVVPSVNENFGITVAEAMAVGTSVVCTEGVGAGEIVRRVDPGCVVPRTLDAVARSLADLLDQPQRRVRFAEAAVSLIQGEYSWSAIATQMEEIMARACKEKRKFAA